MEANVKMMIESNPKKENLPLLRSNRFTFEKSRTKIVAKRIGIKATNIYMLILSFPHPNNIQSDKIRMKDHSALKSIR